MNYEIDITNVTKKDVYLLSEKFCGEDNIANTIKFNNYYMELNGTPFYAISGECHFSRINENRWEDRIRKMKSGGINVISTYLFWNHHEEIEGDFKFDGNKNVRKFIELCKKYDMFLIVRIGPFDHGEVRNGGLPDWLYGKPFEVRSKNDGFLKYTRRLYHNFAKQFEGFYYKDGGPIIGTQIENEYAHSSAPWEMTTAVTNEWIPTGEDGEPYMLALKQIAIEEGIITPFYTCTGWGGAIAPTEEMLPLWGGYAFWPWIFYNYKGDHPVTPEYIYRDNHNNSVTKTYNFEPTYKPESLPYACCEMGGGMTNFYNYRFKLPFESVDAMANIKLASGCNFLGYYMYCGGSNPKGRTTPYLNEFQCTKISYDFQAPIGEYGQIRPSFHRLRQIHIFTQSFAYILCDMTTVLPVGSQDIDPKDTKTLRYAVRTDGEMAFLFLNNYQDHILCEPKENEEITIHLKNEDVTISDLSIAAYEEAILPISINFGNTKLNYATAQPLTSIVENGITTWFFFVPDGMKAKYSFSGKNIKSYNNKNVDVDELIIEPNLKTEKSFILNTDSDSIRIVTLTREESLMFYVANNVDKKTVFLTNGTLTYDNDNIKVEKTSLDTSLTIVSYPPVDFFAKNSENIKLDIFEGVKINIKDEKYKVLIKEISSTRYTITLPEYMPDCKEVLLQIDYLGDIGQAFINGELISDNFYNGATWEIGLYDVWNEKMVNEITILITPIKENVIIDVSSTMAGRIEKNDGLTSKFIDARLKPIYEISL